MTDNLPAQVRDFLARYLRSVEQLKILLLVSAPGEVPWTAQLVYNSILSSRPSVTSWLEDLVNQGLLVHGTKPPLIIRRSTQPSSNRSPP